MNDAVREEWARRVAVEYRSAAHTAELVHRLIATGASIDLVRMAQRIVADELDHAELALGVLAAAGGRPGPVDQAGLHLPRTPGAPLEDDVLRVAAGVFCLGETVAVPLFRRMERHATVPVAKAALKRILRDEGRHRDFGWLLLDWLLSGPNEARFRALLASELPAMLAEVRGLYGGGRSTGLGEVERAWGLLAPADYARDLEATERRVWAPRFAALNLPVGA